MADLAIDATGKEAEVFLLLRKFGISIVESDRAKNICMIPDSRTDDVEAVLAANKIEFQWLPELDSEDLD
jgi:hypothetical protein